MSWQKPGVSASLHIAQRVQHLPSGFSFFFGSFLTLDDLYLSLISLSG